MRGNYSYGRAREIPYYQQSVHNRPVHRIITSENAINERCSQTLPPEWGPHREFGGGFPFRAYRRELLQWCIVNSVNPERHGPLVFSSLQGLAKDHIDAWLFEKGKEYRRKERIKRGNRKYRIQEWERTLDRRIRDAELTRIADLRVEVELYGPDGDPRRDRRDRGAEGKGDGKGDGQGDGKGKRKGKGRGRDADETILNHA